jgi:primary-amine oxidase
MALDRIKQAASHLTGVVAPPHPFDPLSELEIEHAVALVRKEHSDVFFNAVTLWEPRKAEMMKWIKDTQHTPRPTRVADVVCIGRGSKVFEAIVDLSTSKIISWEQKDGVQPLVCTTINKIIDTNCTDCEQITMEDLQIVESIVRKDPKVIEQCGIIGVPPEDMHKVYCDRECGHINCNRHY